MKSWTKSAVQNISKMLKVSEAEDGPAAEKRSRLNDKRNVKQKAGCKLANGLCDCEEALLCSHTGMLCVLIRALRLCR